MFGLKDFSVDFLTATPFLALLAFLGLLALVVLNYRSTNPPLPLYLRVILGVVRIAALLAIVTALFEPVLSYRRVFERPKRVTLLEDYSSSMNHRELGMTRRSRLDSLLSSNAFAKLERATSVNTIYVGGNLTVDAGKVDTEKTALGDALYRLNSDQSPLPADLWLLLSDGKSNAGRTPISVAPLVHSPVTAIDLALDAGDFDVALDQLECPPILFAGRPVKMTVKFSWRNGAGKKMAVQLRGDNGISAQNEFAAQEASGHGELALSFTPPEPGQTLLRVAIPAQEGEETSGNNSRSISVKVLKSRLAVLLVTARPDNEVGFLRRQMLQADQYDVDLRVIGPKAGNLSKQFPSQQTELNRYDWVILHDIDPRLLESRQEIIKSYLSEKGGAIWVIMGDQFADRGPVDWFNKLLPFSQSSHRAAEYLDFHGSPSEANLYHPAVRLGDDRTGIRETWEKLPPFKTLVRCDRIDSGSVVLAYADLPALRDQRVPILGYRRFGPGKLLASAALPFWTWGFAPLGYSEDASSYSRFVNETGRWLTVREDFDPLRVVPGKEVFTRGEPVGFNGYAFDQGYRPLSGITGSVRLRQHDGPATLETDMTDRGEGLHEASFYQVPPGRYLYTGTLRRGEQLLKSNEGTILVEPFSLEEFDQGGDPAVLQSIARLSGGRYYTFRQFDDAIASINLDPIEESVKAEVSLWNQGWLMIAAIAALSLEWLLRKIYQLI